MLPRFLALLTTLGIAATVSASVFVLSIQVVQSPVFWSHLPQANNVKNEREASITLTFVGDIMLAREVEKSIIENGVDWPFAAIKDTWGNSDLVVGNFESTVRDAYRYEGDVLAFDVQPEHIIGLKNAGFTHLSLANNHGDDFGDIVTAYTRSIIENFGITPFGDPSASENFVVHAEPNGVPISLIGFHAFGEAPGSIVDMIATEKAAGQFVIVFPHWGNEYQITPSPAQKSAATMFVEAGADLIVGAHPHVIEPIGNLRGVPVAWSLGNFVFDQDWSQATTEGLVLQVTIDDHTINITPIPITIKNRQPVVMTGSRAEEILNEIGVPDGSVTFLR